MKKVVNLLATTRKYFACSMMRRSMRESMMREKWITESDHPITESTRSRHVKVNVRLMNEPLDDADSLRRHHFTVCPPKWLQSLGALLGNVALFSEILKAQIPSASSQVGMATAQSAQEEAGASGRSAAVPRRQRRALKKKPVPSSGRSAAVPRACCCRRLRTTTCRKRGRTSCTSTGATTGRCSQRTLARSTAASGNAKSSRMPVRTADGPSSSAMKRSRAHVVSCAAAPPTARPGARMQPRPRRRTRRTTKASRNEGILPSLAFGRQDHHFLPPP